MTVVRTTQLIAGLLLRRFVSRLRNSFRAKKTKPGDRSGTGRKRSGNILFLLFLSFAMAIQGVNLSSMALRAASRALGRLPDRQGHAEEGHADTGVILPRLGGWERPGTRPALLKTAGALLLLLAATRFFMSTGSSNQDLGKVEWSAEWLFTFPVPAGHLFAAQIFGYALVDPFSWFATLPFLLTLFYSANLGGWSIPAALFGAFYLSLVMAALRVANETWLRKQLHPAHLKNIQAFFTLAGISLFFFLILLARGGAPMEWLTAKAGHGSISLALNPFSLPAAFCTMPAASMVLWQIGCATVCVLMATTVCLRLVADGLVTASGAYSGKRSPLKNGSDASPLSPSRQSRSPLNLLPGGVIGKDMRLLLRDRNFLVQTLIAPVLVVAFQLFNAGVAHSIGSSFQAAATFAYGLGAYVLVATALSILAVEGNSLWMLYALPMPLHRIMLRKTLLWAYCALAYTVTTLAVCAALRIHSLGAKDLVFGLLACVGVFIYAFIAAGIGMLGTDPLETEVKRRVSAGTIYLYMFLAATYGYALHAPSVWACFGQVVLSSLLTFAIWQKVRDRLPFLLDPVSAASPQITLADGLIAALAFFVLQGVTLMIAVALSMSIGPAITVSFSAAGALVVLITLVFYWRTPHIFFPQGPDERKALLPSMVSGTLAGALAGGVGLIYLMALQRWPLLERFRDMPMPLQNLHGWWLVLLALVAAPLFEEFIFRGLVFRGMRRSLPLAVSIFGSAAIFALCHPPVSVFPVFVMGLLAAWSYERTGRLVAPVLVHIIYNAAVIFLGH